MSHMAHHITYAVKTIAVLAPASAQYPPRAQSVQLLIPSRTIYGRRPHQDRTVALSSRIRAHGGHDFDPGAGSTILETERPRRARGAADGIPFSGERASAARITAVERGNDAIRGRSGLALPY